MTYDEADWLQLSGIQHFKFCRRQWALIHIEQLWAENYRTTDGELLHKNAHDKGFSESRGGLYVTRGMSVHSAELGVSGECDVLEFRLGERGIPLPGKEGLWQPYPVEYKRGKPSERAGDIQQLCAQAICLEEMLCCEVPRGALYFGETRRRQPVEFTSELRGEVAEIFSEMHDLYRRGHTPRVKPKACGDCSLKELCLPALLRRRSARDYIRESWEAEI